MPRDRSQGLPSVSPWAALNLRWNPFGEPTEKEAPSLVVASPTEELTSWIGGERAALQILGAAGRGKTARLLLLQRAFPGAPYVYLAEGERPKTPELRLRESGGPALLLDEAQRLPRRRRLRLFRRAARRGASLALASHRDHSRELESSGFRPRTLRLQGLRVERLLGIVDRRLAWARAAPGPVPRPSGGAASALIRRFGDDLRALLDSLYENYQERCRRAAGANGASL